MDSLPDKFRIHPVKFEGYWKELPESSSCNDYGDHRDEGGIVDNWYMRKFVNIVENYPKDNPSIVDFGGGGGKVFDTLSAITKKSFSYTIVDIVNQRGQEEKIEFRYRIKDCDKNFDIFYTDGTTFITQGYTVKDNLQDAIEQSPDLMVFDRQIINLGEHESFFSYAKELGLFINIMPDKEFISCLSDNGYTVMSSELSHSPESYPIIFNFKSDVDINPVITYKRYVFKKTSNLLNL